MSGKLIVVCGCIGAGKTTFVEALGPALGLRAEPQSYADNPFLVRFYEDQSRWAFASQLYFVVESLRSAADQREGVVRESDTAMTLDVMSREFESRGWLAEEEMNLLAGVARLGSAVEEPDLYLHLDAPADVLRERITRRGRPMEQGIQLEFLNALRSRYGRVLTDMRSNVLTVASDRVDVREPEGLSWVVKRVEDFLRA
jgi:deoxyadenosine/deoxycytidine kinase